MIAMLNLPGVILRGVSLSQAPVPEVYSLPGFADPVSAISHLIAAVVFLRLSIPLLRKGAGHRGRVSVLAILAFGVLFMFSMSSVFHMIPRGTTGRAVLLRLDHASIFVLIAATFTAMHGILFRGWMRWGIIAFVWVFVAAAVPLKTVFLDIFSDWLGLSIYLALGWVGVISGVAIYRRHGWTYVAPVLWGGLAYSFGAVLAELQRPHLIPGVVHGHELFHLFVIAGVGFHWQFCWRIADRDLCVEP